MASKKPRKRFQIIFAKRVKHPGTKKRPFLKPAVKIGVAYVKKEIKKVWKSTNLSDIRTGKIYIALDKVYKKGTELAAKHAMRNAPRKTGRLARSIVVKKRAQCSWYFYSTSSYARWVEEGTRPHTILPRIKKVLRFKIQKGK